MTNDHLSLMPLSGGSAHNSQIHSWGLNLFLCLKTEGKENVKILGSQVTKRCNTEEIQKLVKYTAERNYKCQPNPISTASIFTVLSTFHSAFPYNTYICLCRSTLIQKTWTCPRLITADCKCKKVCLKSRLRFYTQTRVISQKRRRTLSVTTLKESKELTKSLTS